MKSQYKSCFLVIALLATTAFAQAEKRQQINLQQQEIADILAAKDAYAYFGPAICSLSSDLPALKKMAAAAGVDAQHLNALAEIAAQGYTTAPTDMVKAALEEAAACVAACKEQLSAQEVTRIADGLEAYDQTLQSGAADVIVTDDQSEDESEEATTRGTKKFDNVVIRKQASIGSLYVGGDTIINHNLTVNGDEIIHGNLTVYGNTVFTNTATQLIDGSLKVLENIKLPNANTTATVGVLQLGVDPIYEFNMGTSNFFAGDYTSAMPSTITTGSHNIAIGTRANIGLTTASSSISIGTNSASNADSAIALGRSAIASAVGSLALGDNTNAAGLNAISIGTGTSAGISSVGIGEGIAANGPGNIGLGSGVTLNFNRTIGIGSADPSSSGVGPATNGDNAIAIGSAIGTAAAASADAGSIAIGGPGAQPVVATGGAATAIGLGARATFANSIAIGHDVVTTSSGTFIGGIYNALVVGQSVTVKSDGQLGTTVSARRFKENFRNLDNHSAQIYNLNPVKFDYKAEHGGAKDQFGLIADDVAKVLPEIVVHDKDGEIYSVQYHVLPTLLLNEMKHHKKELDALKAEVAMLKAAKNATR